MLGTNQAAAKALIAEAYLWPLWLSSTMSVLCHQSVRDYGNLLTLNLESWFLMVVWRRPAVDTTETTSLEDVLAEHRNLAQDSPWCAVELDP